jgi:tyrosyl-tRNA synthetase
LNAADDDAKKWIKIFTFLSKAAIEDLVNEHDINAASRLLQKRIGKEITLFVHGEEG